jgi:nitronate monooxygenase
MAGGPSTVALAAAVCNAGGLGFLAAGYLSADELAAQIDSLRAVADAPFGVNVFLVRDIPVDEAAVRAYVDSLRGDAASLGVEPGRPKFDDDEFDAKLDLLLAAKVAVVSFTFDCPDRIVVERLQRAGSAVWVTVASEDDAQRALGSGCDALVVQGAEAGGHRGTFEDDGGDAALGLLDLLARVRGITELPLVAAGGIATRADVEAALAAGAEAAQVGTAFLLADEAGTNPLHRSAIASDAPTDWTRAFTGRTARGVVNAFMRDHPDAPVGYPQIHHATAPIRTAARAAGDADRTNLWAGTRHSLARARPAAAIVAELSGRSAP